MGPIADQLLDRRRGDRRRGPNDDDPRPAAAGQRRQGAARRGGHRQDHRRGGPLLAHRPVGLRGQPRGLAGRRPGAASRTWRSADPDLVAEIDERFAATEAELEQHRDGDGWVLHDQLTDEQLQGPQRRDHRADRVGQPGRGGRRRPSDRGPRRTTAPAGRRCPARRLFGLLGAGTAGVAGRRDGRRGDRPGAPRPTRPPPPAPPTRSPFLGAHQAGIVTPAQDRLHFVAFDVITDDRDGAGRDAEGLDGGRPPDDRRPRRRPGRCGRRRRRTRRRTTPARRSGLPPSGLTLTVGFGPTLFTTADGADRFGLAARRPPPLAELPPFPATRSSPAISGGDLCIQACANDPQVAVHAVRNLVRLGRGVVSVRWSQLGFGRTSSTSTGPGDPAQPVRLQGRHEQPQGRGRPAARPVRLGRRRGQRRRLAGRRLVPGHPPDPDADRALGHRLARTSRSGPSAGPRAAARRWASAASSTRSTSTQAGRRRAGRSRRRRTSSWPTRPTRDGDPAPRLQLRRRLGRPRPARRRAVLHRLPARSARPASCRCSATCATDAMNEYIRHTSSAVFACPPGVRGRRRLVGAGALLEGDPAPPGPDGGSPGRRGATGFQRSHPVRRTGADGDCMCRRRRNWSPMVGGDAGPPRAGIGAARPCTSRTGRGVTPVVEPGRRCLGDRYELHQLIAAGGMGQVWRARTSPCTVRSR